MQEVTLMSGGVTFRVVMKVLVTRAMFFRPWQISISNHLFLSQQMIVQTLKCLMLII
jgi:hypothetical protein